MQADPITRQADIASSVSALVLVVQLFVTNVKEEEAAAAGA